jgi:hypothetical protein
MTKSNSGATNGEKLGNRILFLDFMQVLTYSHTGSKNWKQKYQSLEK